MVRPVPWPSLAHHILPTNSSIGAPLGLSGSSAGSWRPSKPNQLPHWTGMISPFLVMLPLSSTRQTPAVGSPPLPSSPPRSEEHTSELQSRGHLVCRLLLEKKKSHRPVSSTAA